MEGMTTLLLLCVAGLTLGVAGLTLWVWMHTRASVNALEERLVKSGEAQSQTAEAFGQIQKTLGELTEAGRHIQELGKEISGLSDLLKPPSPRGSFGELLLDRLLAQILPSGHYELQHTFANGQRVDAVVRLGERMVPVDAKFPLESFRRLTNTGEKAERARRRREFVHAMKAHIDSIADKYIRPDEGTFDFALMYIPAENIYYEAIIKDEGEDDEKTILAHAMKRHVIPVSPNSFYAYLQVIVLGLRGMQIEQRAKETLAFLEALHGDLGKLKREFDVLGTHLQRASNKHAEVSSGMSRLHHRIEMELEPTKELEDSGYRRLPKTSGHEIMTTEAEK